MRNDEGYVGILFRQQLDHRYLSNNVIDHWQRERTRAVADFAGDRGVVTVHLDADEPVVRNRLLNHGSHTSTIPLRVDERESPKAIGTAAHNARNLPIRDGVVGMKGGE